MKALGWWVAVLGVAVAGLGPGASAAAGKYDGSAPLVCAATTVSECDADGRCQRRNAEKVNFPPLFAMILNGAEGEWGWTVLVNEANGKMSAAAAGDGEGFVIFGQCALSSSCPLPAVGYRAHRGSRLKEIRMTKWLAGMFLAAQVIAGARPGAVRRRVRRIPAFTTSSSDACPFAATRAYAPPPPPMPPSNVYSPPPTQPYIYPQRGQSPQQEESDKGQCYGWAVQQTGFDPANPRVAMSPPPPMYSPPPQQSLGGGALEGGLGGAALGAVGGAIGGNAGEGAAIGAAVGGLFGMIRRARSNEEAQEQGQQQQQQQQAYMSQQQNAMARGRSNYNRAFSACMSGRGYTVN
jgi:hypothetical protein